MFVGIGFIAVPLTVYIYTRINAKRRAEMAAIGGGFKSVCKGNSRIG